MLKFAMAILILIAFSLPPNIEAKGKGSGSKSGSSGKSHSKSKSYSGTKSSSGKSSHPSMSKGVKSHSPIKSSPVNKSSSGIQSTPGKSSKSTIAPGTGSKMSSQPVRGYIRKDGTYVTPHRRSTPDKKTEDNWSTKGNSNPYTGKEGSKVDSLKP
jgi:hypothetical protein